MAKRQQSNAGEITPLTTVFLPSTNCAPIPAYTASPGYALAAGADSVTNGQWAIASASPGCDPGDGQITFSPGVCPYGYTPYTAGFVDQTSTTTVACCLTGSLVRTGSSASCELTITDTNSPVMLATEGTTYTLLTTGTLIKGAIWVEWGSSDLNSFSPASAPLLMENALPFTTIESSFSIDTGTSRLPTATTGLSTSNPTTTTSNTPTSTTQAASGGLSTGAQAGIGVGVAVGALAVIIGAVLLIMRKRKRMPGAAPNTQSYEPAAAEPPSYSHDAKARPVYGGQLWPSQQPPNELMANNNPVELDAQSQTYELDDHRPR